MHTFGTVWRLTHGTRRVPAPCGDLLACEARSRQLSRSHDADEAAAYARAGRLREALPLLEQAVARGAAMQLGERQTLRMVLLGTGYLHTGRLQEALLLAQDALVLAQERQEHGFAAYAWRLLGELAAHGTSPEAVTQAETYYRQAMALASDLGMRPLLAHSALGLGTLYSRTGQEASAHTMLSEVVALEHP
jgi:tetratricopeptide (TPR) repeat protein